jgi:hypothetical protein
MHLPKISMSLRTDEKPGILLHDRPCQLFFDCLNGLNRTISERFLRMLHYAFFDCYLKVITECYL